MIVMRISYAIPVCNEHKELYKLLELLIKNKREEDEIVVQADLGNTTREVYNVIDQFKDKIRLVEFPLAGNFGAFKNNLKSNCSGEWIFQIDADEFLREDFIQHLHLILQDNPTIDLFLLPRINTVDGLTQQHIDMWRWQVNEKGWVNFPDYQTRILQNSPKINWVNKVHEVLTGHNTYALFPPEEFYCLIHHKDIKRQEKQNTLYDNL
ncbi:MAG: glycosyltransferase [Actinobacteria bacterium]|nr:glycosyltransferase [Actinomycetota bacterium]